MGGAMGARGGDPELRARLDRLTAELRELAAYRDVDVAPLEPLRFVAGEVRADLAVGDPWPASEPFPVRFEADAAPPARFVGGPLTLRLDVGGEGLLRVDGVARSGLTPYHHEVRLADAAAEGRRWRLEIEAVPKEEFGAPVASPRLREAHWVVPDDAVRELHDALGAALASARALAGERPDAAAGLAAAVDGALRALELPRHDADAYLARLTRDPEARAELESVWEPWRFGAEPQRLGAAARARLTAARDRFEARLAELRDRHPPRGRLHLSGHAHLDLAWLWPLAETRRKMRRTVATVLRLMERDETWTFSQSSAQLYADLERDDPELFARVRERVAEGRWEVTGGMWVEPDGNLLAGESWARQLLTGQRFLQRAFGRRAEVAWLPDTFGYAGNLPQLLRQAGMRWFFTTKLNWNDTTRFPFDLWRWEGIDGSRVLAHSFDNPEHNYNGVLNATDTRAVWARYRGARHHPASLFTFGRGDGGGGPSERMLARARHASDHPAMPALRHGRIDAFYRGIEASLERAAERGDPPLPAWVGEMYLEYHRGTYTSQARIKARHRRLEHTVVDAEAAAALAWRLADAPYPRERIEGIWTRLLRNQFHDILPGSGVRTVAEEAERELEAALGDAEALRDEALDALSRTVRAPGGAERRLVVWNLALEPRALRLELPDPGGRPELAGRPVAAQRLGARLRIDDPDVVVPGLGCVTLELTEGDPEPPATTPLTVRADRLENAALRVEIAPDGSLASFYDKRRDRELLAGAGNRLRLHRDVPGAFEAWELERDYPLEGRDLVAAEPPRVVEAGPLLGAVRVHYDEGGYRVVQDYRLHAHGERLDVRTRVRSSGRRTLLRAEFPLSVRAMEATYETAFGAVTRPTHGNRPHDAARFEVPGLRWADLAEPGAGFSLLTDATYGYSARGNTLGLTLLKGPVYPDPHADLGEHELTYALRPHGGDWRAGTVAAAHDLNAPLRGCVVDGSGGDLPTDEALLTLAAPPGALRLAALKRAEDGDDLILRLYEPHGARGRARLGGALGRAVALTNLLEEDETEFEQGELDYRPFGVRSVRLR